MPTITTADLVTLTAAAAAYRSMFIDSETEPDATLDANARALAELGDTYDADDTAAVGERIASRPTGTAREQAVDAALGRAVTLLDGEL